MSLSPINSDATIVSHGEAPVLIKTPFTDMMLQHSKNTKMISMPVTHVVTAFVNRYLNMEDGCCVSKEWAESGALTWSGYINYPLPQSEGRVKIGMSTKDRYWWKPAIDGIAVDVKTSKVELGDRKQTRHHARPQVHVGGDHPAQGHAQDRQREDWRSRGTEPLVVCEESRARPRGRN
ncbi:hypothetical protein TI39_contig4142g00006 [Zymoseptoria brevis]|uniref:Uncharacterized protein n=1 Tax=Zymoseptoria brevis TaxID=1047168 RepID=A0A0F4GFS7_9PEZI|nr:hypothetical protein TI39_contig4142g00006 [Zymoseptoria brevis]